MRNDKKLATVWIHDETWEKFQKLCSAYGTDRAKAIRLLINDALERWALPTFVRKPNPKTGKRSDQE